MDIVIHLMAQYPFFGSLLEFQSYFLGCSCCEWPYFEGQFLTVNPSTALLGTRRRRRRRRRHVVTVSSSVVCCACASVHRARDVAVAGEIMPLGSEGRFCRIIPRKSNRQPRIVPLRAIVCVVATCIYCTMSLGCPKHHNTVIHPFHILVSAEQTTFSASMSREFVHFKGGRKQICQQGRAEDRGRGGCGSSMVWTLFVRETVA